MYVWQLVQFNMHWTESFETPSCSKSYNPLPLCSSPAPKNIPWPNGGGELGSGSPELWAQLQATPQPSACSPCCRPPVFYPHSTPAPRSLHGEQQRPPIPASPHRWAAPQWFNHYGNRALPTLGVPSILEAASPTPPHGSHLPRRATLHTLHPAPSPTPLCPLATPPFSLPKQSAKETGQDTFSSSPNSKIYFNCCNRL